MTSPYDSRFYNQDDDYLNNVYKTLGYAVVSLIDNTVYSVGTYDDCVVYVNDQDRIHQISILSDTYVHTSSDLKIQNVSTYSDSTQLRKAAESYLNYINYICEELEFSDIVPPGLYDNF